MSIADDVEALEAAHRELIEAAHVARQTLEEIVSLYEDATDISVYRRIKTMTHFARDGLSELKEAGIDNGSDEG